MGVATARPLDFRTIRKGMRARVVQVARDVDGLRRLVEMGLTPGTEFRVIKVAPFGDPVEIDVRGYRLCLRRCESEGIEIEPIV